MNAGKGTPRPQTLRAISLPKPTDFPVGPYEAIYEAVTAKYSQHALCAHHADAWNALAYRYRETVDAGELFASLLRTHGTAPIPEQRYAQERAVFDFYSSGFSAFECAFYGFYAIGAFLGAGGFTLATERDQQRVSPSSTSAAYTRAFPNDPFSSVLISTLADADFQNWRAVRNVLTHRTAPGRRMYVSIGGDDALPTEWKLNSMPLDETIAIKGRRNLVRVLETLLIGGAEFVTRKL
jgi:hypothetical protein